MIVNRLHLLICHSFIGYGHPFILNIAAHVYFIDKANGLSDTVLGVIQGLITKMEFELHNVEKKVSYAPKSRRIESMIIECR